MRVGGVRLDGLMDLIIPFIALAIISLMIDKFTLFLEGLVKRIPFLPDQFDWWVAYLIVLTMAFLVCWQGNFDLFWYLHIHFAYPWEGWLMTALIISGGSSFVRTNFTLIDSIIGSVVGTLVTIKRIIVPGDRRTEIEYDESYYPDYGDEMVNSAEIRSSTPGKRRTR